MHEAVSRFHNVFHVFISVPVVHMRDAAGLYKIPTWDAAASQCASQGMRLATRAQLEHARKLGLDVCACGWLADGTVGYPILKPRKGCGGNARAGVRTCSSTPSGVGWDAYCTKSLGNKKRKFSFGKFSTDATQSSFVILKKNVIIC